MIPVALTLAGSDPSGGAGIQADLKTFHQRNVYGMAALTLLTIQNTRGVREVLLLDPSFIKRQVKTVISDIRPQAVKTGALGSGPIIHAAACCLKKIRCPIVVDPVMVSKHGALLLQKSAVTVFKKELLPLAVLVTPNLDEAAALAGFPVHDLETMEKAARMIAKMGVKAVLIKGGHLKGPAADLFYEQDHVMVLNARRIRTRHTHGTGCTYAAAITAELAKGKTLLNAIKIAKRFVTQAIQKAPGFGHGVGPVNHWAVV